MQSLQSEPVIKQYSGTIPVARWQTLATNPFVLIPPAKNFYPIFCGLVFYARIGGVAPLIQLFVSTTTLSSYGGFMSILDVQFLPDRLIYYMWQNGTYIGALYDPLNPLVDNTIKLYSGFDQPLVIMQEDTPYTLYYISYKL
jgi:hypothetical protein